MTTIARLKRKLKRHGYTQEQLAKIIVAMTGKRCTRTYINHVFAGRRSPKWLRAALEQIATIDDRRRDESAA